MKYSKNKKLNNVLNDIEESIKELDETEVKRYMQVFKHEIDYNIAQYGNLLIYYDHIRELYRKAGYKSIEKMSDEKIWNIYKRQVGYVCKVLYLKHDEL